MREFTVPPTVTIPPDQNMTDRIFDNASRHGDDIAFARKVSGSWQNITAKEFASDVRQVAAGLIASGVEPGDRVALFSRTRYEWTV
ncbi:MAG: AMP-binding protein, partial [Mycobacteriaceae bacterium]